MGKIKLTTSVLNRVSEKPLVLSAFPFKRKLIIKTVSVLCHGHSVSCHGHYGHQFLFWCLVFLSQIISFCIIFYKLLLIGQWLASPKDYKIHLIFMHIFLLRFYVVWDFMWFESMDTGSNKLSTMSMTVQR